MRIHVTGSTPCTCLASCTASDRELGVGHMQHPVWGVILLLTVCSSHATAGRHLTQGSATNLPTAANNSSVASSTGMIDSNSSAVATGDSNTGFPGYPLSAGLLAPELVVLLSAIQEQRLYNDSKTAVDLVLKAPASDVASAYQSVTTVPSTSGTSRISLDRGQLHWFVNRTMDPAGSDLIQCQAPDWQPKPPDFLPRLTAAADSGSDAAAKDLLQFGLAVHNLWGLLCRQVSPNVSAALQQHSLLPLPNRTIVPGDRFRETYYWDSYWIVRGLLVSGMNDTAASLLDNLFAMLERVGHVPNGARVYYLNRSQPPLLSAMVRALYEASGAATQLPLLQRALPLLVTEHQYWTRPPKALNISDANGNVHSLSRYWADWYQPRPESYREDSELARNVTGTSSPTNSAAAQLYHELSSGAESGWDYSSRWFADGKTLGTIRTSQIIPADLNGWLYQMERNIAWAANLTGDGATSDRFNKAAAARKEAMDRLLWDNTTVMWRDGILSSLTNSNGTTSQGNGTDGTNQVYMLALNPGISASNFIPLWAGLSEGDEAQGARVVQSLQDSGLISASGIATTLYRTGQQWDYPNGWPPLQHMLIEGASQYGGDIGHLFAAKMARTWVMMNMRVFNRDGHMHEKYDVSQAEGGYGGGGEYAPQIGFGWSNGVVLDLLNTYF